MANKDLLITQEQAAGAPKNIIVTPVAGQFLKTNGSNNPITALPAAADISDSTAAGRAMLTAADAAAQAALLPLVPTTRTIGGVNLSANRSLYDIGVVIPSTLTLIADTSNNVKGYGLTTIPNSWQSGAGTLKGLSIGQGVTSIGSSAFYDCAALVGTLIIPNSVTSIGNYAFYSCDGITKLVISNSVTSLGSYMMQGSSGLTAVTISNSVTSIGGSAFQGCINLVNVDCYVTKTIIDSATSIFQTTSVSLVIHARASDSTWTAGIGLTIGGNSSVDVVKDL
ncbi:leucine-rich repeat domain-containing protein [Propionivibrio sp.]|uniref:leucine-rich repeat domain-containing protein n=1 Tax=Propionivibrio sp. TaxID=2212460 RepID=UPI003BF308E7